jgi:predicted N-formylglutamate amidohydrolase
MPAAALHYLVSCEHGGKRVPARYRHFFRGREELLQSHRAYDVGALALARDLAEALQAPLFVSTTSRLLIDLNRSVGHPRLNFAAIRQAPAMVRSEILERYYLPYRNRVEADIASAVGHGSRVIHVSSHSFTPELDGEVRNADIGLLYDPARGGEVELCSRWRAAFKTLAPQLKVRRNYPYAGRSDGFTAYLRRRFPANAYVGIELEINQRHVLKAGRHWQSLRGWAVQALGRALAGC